MAKDQPLAPTKNLMLSIAQLRLAISKFAVEDGVPAAVTKELKAGLGCLNRALAAVPAAGSSQAPAES